MKASVHDPNDPRHQVWLRQAVELSQDGMRNKRGGPFGAVIVRDDELVATGCNQVTSALDPTAHAEVVAIRNACSALGRFDLSGCRIYSSCEPCPMCLGAIYWARLDALYFANTRKDAANIDFDDEKIYVELQLPLTQRSMPTIHMPDPEAMKVFEAWTQLAGKTRY